MGGACRTYGRGKVYTGVWWENLRKRDHSEDRDVDGRNILRLDLQEVGCEEGMGWIELAQDRDRWWTLVNAVMNLGFPYNAGNFLTS